MTFTHRGQFEDCWEKYDDLRFQSQTLRVGLWDSTPKDSLQALLHLTGVVGLRQKLAVARPSQTRHFCCCLCNCLATSHADPSCGGDTMTRLTRVHHWKMASLLGRTQPIRGVKGCDEIRWLGIHVQAKPPEARNNSFWPPMLLPSQRTHSRDKANACRPARLCRSGARACPGASRRDSLSQHWR